MNTIKQSISSFLATARGAFLNMRIVIAVVLCVVLIGAFIYFAHRSASSFSDDYSKYAPLADQGDNAAYIPGATTNPVRQQLNQILTQVLAQKMSASDRLKLSNQGLLVLKDSEKQIDEISVTGSKVDVMIAKMQLDALGGFSSSETAREIVGLAKQRSGIVSDIRAYSYRADFEIDKIFQRIITDGGKLTDAYVIELNNDVPAVEAQFNKRSNLYNQLQVVSDQIKDKAKGL